MVDKIFLGTELRELFNNLIAKRTGLKIREQDKFNLNKHIWTRMKALQLKLPEDYYQLLESDIIASNQEWHNLVVLLTNNESYFFRDDQQINVLRNHIFPELIKRKQSTKTIRICSAGCSTGEEPYSLAIILKELIPDLRQWNLTILGIDINRVALRSAEEGIYSPWSFRGVSEDIKQRYFQLINNRYHLSREIKQMVKFQTINLLKDPFPQIQFDLKDMDLLICRNVFIYFKLPAIASVLEKIYHTLQPLGYFIAGHAELAGQDLSQFQTLAFPESIVYQRPDSNNSVPKNPNLVYEKNLISQEKLPDQFSSRSTHLHFSSLISPENNKSVGLPKVEIPNIGELERPLTKINHQKAIGINLSEQQQATLNIQETIQQAELLWQQQKYNLAINQLEKVLASNNISWYVYQLMAQIYADMGKYEVAAQSCQQALEIDAVAVSTHYLLAKIAEEKGNIEKAKQIFKKIIYLDQEFVLAYLDLSYLYQQEGDKQRSSKMQQNAIDILYELPPDTKIKGRDNLTAAQLIGSVLKLNFGSTAK